MHEVHFAIAREIVGLSFIIIQVQSMHERMNHDRIENGPNAKIPYLPLSALHNVMRFCICIRKVVKSDG